MHMLWVCGTRVYIDKFIVDIRGVPGSTKLAGTTLVNSLVICWKSLNTVAPRLQQMRSPARL